MKNGQRIFGFFLFGFALLLAYWKLATVELFYRFAIGIGFGFFLTRASIGFAGGVNRISREGNASLAKALLVLFVLSAFFTSFLTYNSVESYSLNINPINLGLIVGGLFFGFGMALSSCCATGSLTDLAGGFSRAGVTIFFFGMGVFLGFYTQTTASWIRESWVSTATGELGRGGVFLPDLFVYDGLKGYAGAIILTALFSGVLIYIAAKYEKKLDMYTPAKKAKSEKFLSYETFFVKPWSMFWSSVGISLLFIALLEVSAKGWSATTPFGVWFAKILMLFGVSAEWIAEYTNKPVALFSRSLLEYGVSLQNFGIILGTIIALLLAGSFKNKFTSGLKITPKAFFIYAFGGFIMGIGTRLSNGCNVGALFTPISEFSLSGWFYLVFVVIGGFSGNWFLKRYISKTCSF